MQYLLNSSNNEEFGSLSNAFFTDFGINYFLDFTENGEIPPYAPFLTNRIGRYSFPIPNGCVPNSVRWVVYLFRIMTEVLNKLETKLYIHCVGGIGRTGSIVACYYVYIDLTINV